MNVDERFVDNDVARRCGLCGSKRPAYFSSVSIPEKKDLSLTSTPST